jgi:hypothetical protein
VIGNFWRMPWSTAFGVMIGVLAVLSTPTVIGPLRDVYDASFPVLRMTGTVVSRDGDSVTLHIKGEKLRGEECRLLAVYGYGIDRQGRLSDANASRTDAAVENRVRDRGVYDIGLWRVRPIGPDAVAVRVVTQHDCIGRVVLSTIAEATL